jgi:hypothetical protein
MVKAGLLQAVCALGLLAAAPAFAQTDTQPADTGVHNSVNVPEAPGGGSTMAPAQRNGSDSMSTMSGHMAHRHGAMHAKADSSQDSEVNRLNDQSYQAAQRGEAFSASNASAGGGQMNTMPGVSAPGTGDAADNGVSGK